MILEIIIHVIQSILRIYQVILGLTILLSWLPSISNNKFGRFIYEVSDWYYGYFGDILVIGGLNFTKLIAISIFEFVIQLL